MYCTWAVQSYNNNIATIVRTSIHTFYLEKLISCYCFLNKSSKELFDYVVGIHRHKEDFLKKKRCNVPFELHKGMQNIIIIVKKYIYNFHYLKQEGKSLLKSLLLEGCYFRRVTTFGGGCYFGNFTVLFYKKLSQSGQYKNYEYKHCFFLFFSPSPPPTYFFLFLF